MVMTKRKDNFPRHVAIIMDGNGRWAKQRGKERIEGHYEGVKALREIIDHSVNLGISYLSVYAFSTENWARPVSEVEGIMELFCKTIEMELPTLNERGVKVKFLTEERLLSHKVVEIIRGCEQSTSQNNSMTLLVALNYGSRSEILQATKQLAQEVKQGVIEVDQITEEIFSNRLFTGGVPDPDLLIRTSGEYRLSNFLLWQLSYAEFYFTDVLWPDFSREEYDIALNVFESRSRRYGKTE